jgi:hypothetical protein
MAPVLQSIATSFINQPATPNPRLMDAPRPSNLACILRAIITTALQYGVSASNCTDRYRYLLALGNTIQPQSRRRADSSHFRREMTPFKIHVLTSMWYPLRSFVRLILYSGAHSHPFRPFSCSTRYLLQLYYIHRLCYDLTDVGTGSHYLCNEETFRYSVVSTVATNGYYSSYRHRWRCL